MSEEQWTKQDNIGLVCSVAEIVNLFERTSSLQDFLQTVISTVAYHMRAAVCSIYLLDEKTDELVLRANQGLNSEAIGQLRLKMGEGIAGTALKEMNSIREGIASENPAYRHFEGIDEEQYSAFLAVPIVRNNTRIGVLVVQDPKDHYFTAHDEMALKAIAHQMATAIENAKLLLQLHEDGAGKERPELKKPAAVSLEDFTFIKGKPASFGVAVGAFRIFDSSTYLMLDSEPGESKVTLEDFDRALDETLEQIEELEQRMEEQLSDVASLIFNAHLLILKDSNFSGTMREKIVLGTPPRQAITEVVNHYIDLFSQSTSGVLREKMQDVKDLGNRIIKNMLAHDPDKADYHGQILIAAEVLPSDILKLAAQRAEGLILISGGITSHLSILARSLSIPVVLSTDRRLLGLHPGTPGLLDANSGSIFIQPDQKVLTQYEPLDQHNRRLEVVPDVAAETHTLDGTRVRLMANISLLSDANLALQYHAEGVGLYRTEFPFIVRNNFPPEEEQLRIYQDLYKVMGDRPVVFRTLDIGGDKMLSYFPHINESNPFLGLRAIRFSLRNKDIFMQQLRALLRAGVDHDLKIMFPLISSIDDLDDVRTIVSQCIEELHTKGVPHNSKPKLGIMVELPSAVELINEAAREVDFISIGSNDLIQYFLAVDRTNAEVSDFYLAHHPAILRALKRIAVAAEKYQVDLSLCGDLAAETNMLPFLLGIGIRYFSVSSRKIPIVQEAVNKIHILDAVRIADEMLSCGRIREVDEYLLKLEPSS